jgi:hypothetical protein
MEDHNMAIDGGLRALFRKHLANFMWTSIESGMTQRGIPDANYCCSGVEGWVEYKLTKGWTVGLRPEQIAWHLQRRRMGGRSFIAVRRMNKTDDELWLYQGAHAKWLKTGGIKAICPEMTAYGGPGAWDWGRIRQTLLGQPDIDDMP